MKRRTGTRVLLTGIRVLLSGLPVLLGLTGILASQPAGARDLYVNNQSGDDRRDGSFPDSQGKAGGPLKSIRRALQLASKGDRIILANTGQPYRESVTIQAGSNSGLPDHPFTIVGNDAVLEGTRPVPPALWEHVEGDVFRFQPARMAHQILYLDDKPARRVPLPESGQRPRLQPLEWCLAGGHIYFRTEPAREPASYLLAYAALPVGITIYEARHVVIQNLVIQGFQLDGINAHDSAFDVTLAGLNCRGNGRSGISIGGASRVRVVSCLVGNNGRAQLRTEGYSHTVLRNCDLLDTDPRAPAIVREGGQITVEDAESRDAGTAASTAGTVKQAAVIQAGP